MTRVLVIADDLSGAAEIAGVGLRYGLPTRLLRERPVECGEGLTVIDSDSRDGVTEIELGAAWKVIR